MIEIAINIILFLMLVVTALAIIRMDKLFAVVMLSGVFSFLSALLFIVMDAVDVAFTEAAVGAGITTVLMLGTIALTARTQKKSPKFQLMPVLIIIIIGVALIYGTMDMPNFGDLNSPANTHVAAYYVNNSATDIGVPNMVTGILASYRGFDTLGEVAVVFTAGVGVLVLLSCLLYTSPSPRDRSLSRMPSSA